MKRLNWLDRLIYRVFFWRWKSILIRRPDLRELFIAYLKSFDMLDEGSPISATVTIRLREEGADDGSLSCL